MCPEKCLGAETLTFGESCLVEEMYMSLPWKEGSVFEVPSNFRNFSIGRADRPRKSPDYCLIYEVNYFGTIEILSYLNDFCVQI